MGKPEKKQKDCQTKKKVFLFCGKKLAGRCRNRPCKHGTVPISTDQNSEASSNSTPSIATYILQSILHSNIRKAKVLEVQRTEERARQVRNNETP
jgi:hypothetical protein